MRARLVAACGLVLALSACKRANDGAPSTTSIGADSLAAPTSSASSAAPAPSSAGSAAAPSPSAIASAEAEAEQPPEPGPAGWSVGVAHAVGRPPKRDTPKRAEVPAPWPECATSLGRAANEKRLADVWSRKKDEAKAAFEKADAAEQARWAPLQRAFWQRRRELLDDVAAGCATDAAGGACATLAAQWRADKVTGAFSCEAPFVMRAAGEGSARDLVLCEAKGRWVLIEIPVDARAAVLGPELATAVEREGLAAAIGAKDLGPGGRDSIPRRPAAPAKLTVRTAAKLTRSSGADGDAARALEALVAQGFGPTLVSALWSRGDLWSVALPSKGGDPPLTLDQKGEDPPPPRVTAGGSSGGGQSSRERSSTPRASCDGKPRWELAACQSDLELGDLGPWFTVAGGVARPRLVSFPAAPGPAIGASLPETESARVLAFRKAVARAGGFQPFECEIKDVTLGVEGRGSLDTRSIALAKSAGLARGELVEWRLACSGDGSTTGGSVVIHVPSHLVWAEASLGPGGYAVGACHAERGAHFVGALRAVAEPGLLDLPKGAKLAIGGYTELRLDDSGTWHVGFRSSCPDKGLACEFRDGRGEPSIGAVAMDRCDVAAFAY